VENSVGSCNWQLC